MCFQQHFPCFHITFRVNFKFVINPATTLTRFLLTFCVFPTILLQWKIPITWRLSSYRDNCFIPLSIFIRSYLRERVKSVSQLFSYYPAASQPTKNDVRFSNLKTWSGSGQNPQQWRARTGSVTRDFWLNEMRMTCVSHAAIQVLTQIGVFVLKNAWQNRVSVVSYFLQVSEAHHAAFFI